MSYNLSTIILYGYKSTVGIALGTLKLSANICRHNKCRRSLTEPTTQVSAKVCTVLPYSAFGSFHQKDACAGVKQAFRAMYIARTGRWNEKKPSEYTPPLPLSPTARKGKSPAAHTRATREYARRRCLPRTPSLAASHTEPRCRRPPAQRRRLPPFTGTLTTDAPSPAVSRRR